eukprot:4425735-Amphidinium_carterae.1
MESATLTAKLVLNCKEQDTSQTCITHHPEKTRGGRLCSTPSLTSREDCRFKNWEEVDPCRRED